MKVVVTLAAAAVLAAGCGSSGPVRSASAGRPAASTSVPAPTSTAPSTTAGPPASAPTPVVAAAAPALTTEAGIEVSPSTPVPVAPPPFPDSGLPPSTYSADAAQDAKDACQVVSLWVSEPSVAQFVDAGVRAGGNATADETPDAGVAAYIAFGFAFQAHEIASTYLTGHDAEAWDQFALGFKAFSDDKSIDNPASHAKAGNDLNSLGSLCRATFGFSYPTLAP